MGRRLLSIFARLFMYAALFATVAAITAQSARAETWGWGDVDLTNIFGAPWDTACPASGNDRALCERLEALLFYNVQMEPQAHEYASQSEIMLECLVLLAMGNRLDGYSPSNANSCIPFHTGSNVQPTLAQIQQGADIRGPLAVKNESGGKLDVHCTTGSPSGPCAGSGGGGVSCTETEPCQVVIDDGGNVVSLSEADAQRSDLMWWGVWAAVGLSLCALVTPVVMKSFAFWRGD